ncbi:MAG: hypothetical protein ABI771_12265 [Betaproteobacteria bacterium]
MAIYEAFIELVCVNCGAVFRPPIGTTQKTFPAVIERESTHCAQVIELVSRERALRVRIQAGFADLDRDMDTADLFAHRLALARLEVAINREKVALLASMRHAPPGAR